MRRKQGISLIVLAITIIVMIILAASVIISLTSTGIIGKANNVVNKTNLKEVESLATLAWADAFMDGARTEDELKVAVDEALKDVDTSEYDVIVTDKGVTVTEKTEQNNTNNGPVVHSGTIPEGAVYYVGVLGESSDYTTATATYTEGDPFPETTNVGDIYVYGDYEYRYNMGFVLFGWADFTPDYGQDVGWGALLLKNKDKDLVSDILPEINEKPISIMAMTYINCKNMTKTPKIPDGVKYMPYAYSGCENLIEAPTLPSGLINMSSMFQQCTNLKTYEGSKQADGDFSNYIIPENVTNLSVAFQKCLAMKTTPKWNNIKAAEVGMYSVCEGCTSLETVTTLPNGVIDLNIAFKNCTSLKNVASLANASKLTKLESTFENCTSLTTTPVFSDSITDMSDAFTGCTALVTVNKLPENLVNLDWTFNECRALVAAPAIPTKVESMEATFRNCVNLTGNLEINVTSTNTTNFLDCLVGTVKPIRITGTCATAIKKIIYDFQPNVTY